MLLERDSRQEEINNIYQSECDAYKFIRDMRKILLGVRLETETSSLEIQNHSMWGRRMIAESSDTCAPG